MWYQIMHGVLTEVDDNGNKRYYNKTIGSEKWMLSEQFIKEFNK
jgi:hypothetical protein